MRPGDFNPVRLFRGNNSNNNDAAVQQPQNDGTADTVRRGNLGDIQESEAANDQQSRVDEQSVGREMSGPIEGRATGRLGKIAGLAAFGALNIGVYEGFRSGAIQNFFTGPFSTFFSESVPHFFTDTLKLGMEVGVNASPLGVVMLANVGFAALTKMSYSAFSNQLEKSSVIQKLKDKDFQTGQQLTAQDLVDTGLSLGQLQKFNLVKGERNELVNLDRASLMTSAKTFVAGAAVVGSLAGAGAYNGSVFGGGFGGGIGAMAGAMAGLALVGVKYGAHLQSELHNERAERVSLANRLDVIERGGNRAVEQHDPTEFDLALEALSPEQRQRYENNMGGVLEDEESDILTEAEFTARDKVQFWANLPEDKAQALLDKKQQVSTLKAELERIAVGSGEGLVAKGQELKTAKEELDALVNESLNIVAATVGEQAEPVLERNVESDSQSDVEVERELDREIPDAPDLERESANERELEIGLESDSESGDIDTAPQKSRAANDAAVPSEQEQRLNVLGSLLPQKYRERFDLLNVDEKQKFHDEVQNSPTLGFMFDLKASGQSGQEDIETNLYDAQLEKLLPATDNRAAM